MSNILRLILTLFFDAYHPLLAAVRVLYIIGAWLLFRKSGIKSWWALIPWAREYQLGRCAAREPEGRYFCVTSMMITVLSVAGICFQWNRDNEILIAFVPLILVILVSVTLVHYIYNIRVFAGFVRIYGVSRWWLVFCVFDELRFIPMLVWGASGKYQPAWKVEDLKAQMERLAAHGSAAVMAEGLTVNLKDVFP